MDFVKQFPTEDDQMEMMLLQMDKLPDFSGGFYEDLNPFLEQNVENPNSAIAAENPNYVINSPGSTGGPQPPPPAAAALFHNHEAPAQKLSSQQSDCGGDEHYYSGEVQKGNGNSMAAMREMIFRIAAMQPVHIDQESVKPPKRKNVRISTDPQSVAARHRRERISERIRILQRLVPGGTKMDTASMLDEAIHYVKFLKNQVQSLERVAANRPAAAAGGGAAVGMGFPVPMSSGNLYLGSDGKGYR